MNGESKGSILIELVDGTRQPLPATVKWSARIFDGRAPSAWHETDVNGSGSAELVKGLRFFDNFFDNYTVIVFADKYQGGGLEAGAHRSGQAGRR
jgi:hypothetical protein